MSGMSGDVVEEVYKEKEEMEEKECDVGLITQ
jgi:hypothetical protein